jgi:hypothetical protein
VERMTIKGGDGIAAFYVETPPCPLCGMQSWVGILEFEVPGYLSWAGGALLQRAFPTWSADRRELLKTGFHPDCWSVVFGEED